MAILHAHHLATAATLAENLINYGLEADEPSEPHITYEGRAVQNEGFLSGQVRYAEGLRMLRWWEEFGIAELDVLVNLGGEDFAVDGTAIIGGTLRAIQATDGWFDEYTRYVSYELAGIEADAAAVYNANVTETTDDDLAFIPLFFAGDDQLWLSDWGDDLSGYAGNDTVYGFDGNDTLRGGEGADRVEGGDDADALHGDAGNDSLRGGSGNDALDGGSESDDLQGGAGNDALTGGLGADLLEGGAGADTVQVGAGADTVVIRAQAGSASDSARLPVAGANNDRGQDTVGGFSLVEDRLKIVATQVDRFVHGVDTSVGAGTGADTAGSRGSFTSLTGLVELNQATNDGWSDAGDVVVTFVAPSSAFTEAAFEARLAYDLTGRTTANVLTGGLLADALRGMGGNDVLTGGRGSDLLAGGTGNDLFDFNSAADSSVLAAGRDTISDFVRGQDRIDLRNIDANTAVANDQAFSGTLVAASAPFTAAGQLRLADGILYGNTDADADAEFSIALTGVTALATSDFLL